MTKSKSRTARTVHEKAQALVDGVEKHPRFKFTTNEGKVYYVYGRTTLLAEGVFFGSPVCKLGTVYTIDRDAEEWKTSLFEGRAAPGA